MDSEVRQSPSTEEFCRRLATVPLCHESGDKFTYSVATGGDGAEKKSRKPKQGKNGHFGG
eukprot:633769-Amphidinium_carterae.1